MMTWLKIAQFLIAILLIVAILLQGRGAGLSGVFGGSSAVFRTKRGLEKTLFSATIILAVLFFSLALTQVIMAK
jgi:preprotein translocase subunit SecG